MTNPTYEFDFLVIGSGIAGLSFALKAAENGSVAIITKKEEAESNTNYAQGGIASVIDPHDSFESHIEDTLSAGAGLCHKDAVELMVKDGPDAIDELIKIGTDFTKSENGKLALGREGGHSRNRIVHSKDLTGREVERALLTRLHSYQNVTIFQNHIAIDLLTEHQLKKRHAKTPKKIHCWGVYALDCETQQVKMFLAKVTLLCTGGAGQVYRHTTNPGIATGDGIAMAYRAGAQISNLEFMQFHPTALYHPESHSFLISEAVRGFGGILKNLSDEDFMQKYDNRRSLAPRDIVARAIDNEMKRSGDPCVFLDLRHLNAEDVKTHFPNIYQKCLTYKIDITREQIPVVPAAHYMCGGVLTDLSARSTIENLFAFGEVACTGVHGANRLASNSLLEALVFSHQAFIHSVTLVEKSGKDRFPELRPWIDTGEFDTEEWVLISHDKQEIQQLMWDYVGIVRSNLRLLRAERRIGLIHDEVESFFKKTTVTPELLELRNISLVARLIILSAMIRKESRGLHFNTDYPERDDRQWKKDTILN